jgi:hypothetical protein
MTEKFVQPNADLETNISRLGPREKNAFRAILIGFRETIETDKEQAPIKLVKSLYKPFNLDVFGKVLEQMNISIENIRTEKDFTRGGNDTIIIFEPVIKDAPDRYPTRELVASKENTKNFIEKHLSLFPISQDPQK